MAEHICVHGRRNQKRLFKIICKANGDNENAKATMNKLSDEMSKREIYLERYFDHELAIRKLTINANT